MSDQEGIRTLLKAEVEAKEEIAKAKKARETRIRQATEEAEKEIGAYKESLEKQFQEYSSQRLGSAEEVTKQIERDTDNEIRDMQAAVSSKKTDVVDLLLKSATTVA
eukprot:Rmarinus@m.5768